MELKIEKKKQLTIRTDAMQQLRKLSNFSGLWTIINSSKTNRFSIEGLSCDWIMCWLLTFRWIFFDTHLMIIILSLCEFILCVIGRWCDLWKCLRSLSRYAVDHDILNIHMICSKLSNKRYDYQYWWLFGAIVYHSTPHFSIRYI